MTAIVIEHARFIEVQQRRARIVAELGYREETGAPRTSLPVTDESAISERQTLRFELKTTRGAIDGLPLQA